MASLTVVGPPWDLAAHTRTLLGWAADKNLRFDQVQTNGAEQWTGLLGIYNATQRANPTPPSGKPNWPSNFSTD